MGAAELVQGLKGQRIPAEPLQKDDLQRQAAECCDCCDCADCSCDCKC